MRRVGLEKLQVDLLYLMTRKQYLMRFIKYASLVHPQLSSGKFWIMDAKGDKLTITEGTESKSKQITKAFSSFEKCIEAAQDLIEKKLKAGYVEGSLQNKNLGSRDEESLEHQESIRKTQAEKRK